MPVEEPEAPRSMVIDGRTVGLVTAVIVVVCTLVVAVLRPASYGDRLVALLFGVGLAALIVVLSRRRSGPPEDTMTHRDHAGLVAEGEAHPVIPEDLNQPREMTGQAIPPQGPERAPWPPPSHR